MALPFANSIMQLQLREWTKSAIIQFLDDFKQCNAINALMPEHKHFPVSLFLSSAITEQIKLAGIDVDVEQNVLDYLKQESKTENISQLLDQFNNLSMDKDIPVNERIEKYKKDFYKIYNSKPDGVRLTDKQVVRLYIKGIKPKQVATYLFDLVKFQDYTLAKIIKKADKELLRQQKVYKSLSSQIKRNKQPSRGTLTHYNHFNGRTHPSHMSSPIPHKPIPTFSRPMPVTRPHFPGTPFPSANAQYQHYKKPQDKSDTHKPSQEKSETRKIHSEKPKDPPYNFRHPRKVFRTQANYERYPQVNQLVYQPYSHPMAYSHYAGNFYDPYFIPQVNFAETPFEQNLSDEDDQNSDASLSDSSEEVEDFDEKILEDFGNLSVNTILSQDLEHLDDKALTDNPDSQEHTPRIALSTCEQKSNKTFTIDVCVNNVPLPGIIDTGANISCISEDLVEEIKGTIIKKETQFTTADQKTCTSPGFIKATVSLRLHGPAKDTVIESNLMILKCHKHLLIGCDILRTLGLMGDNFIFINTDTKESMPDSDAELTDRICAPLVRTEGTPRSRGLEALKTTAINVKDKNDKSQILTMLHEFAHVFDTQFTPGGIKCEPMPVPFINEAEIACSPARRLSPPKQEIVKKIFDELVESNIAYDNNDGPHASPIVLVTYSDPNKKPRLTGDYKKINALTKTIPVNLPLMSDVWNILSKAQFIACFDLPRAYYQFPLAPEDRSKTTLVTLGRAIAFLVAPFGLKNIPAWLQNFMSRTFVKGKYAEHVFPWYDDLIVAGTNIAEFLNVLRFVFQQCEKARITLSAIKSIIATYEFPIRIMGTMYVNHNKFISDEKIQAMKNLRAPQTKAETQKLIGMFNWIREFVPNFSQIARPLYQLTSEDSPFVWSAERDNALQRLKKIACSNTVLMLPNDDLPIIVTTDASDTTVAGVIFHEIAPLTPPNSPLKNKRIRPISYYSKTLTDSQRGWTTMVKECYAIMKTITQRAYEPLLKSKEFTIYTDNRNLSYISRTALNSAMISRWLPILADFNFNIFHLSGKENVWSDVLSRFSSTSESTDDIAPNEVDTFSDEAERKQTFDIHSIRTLLPEIPFLSELKSFHKTLDANDPELKNFTMNDQGFFISKGKIFVPVNLRNYVLNEAHGGNILSSHRGIHSSECRIHQFGLSWPTIHNDITEWINTCPICQKTNHPGKNKVSATGNLFACKPFEALHIDTMGPFSEDNMHNRYIIVMIDAFSRYTELYPTQVHDADNVAKALVHRIICRYGIPDRLHSDNGLEYCNKVIESLLTELKIDHTKAFPYFHQSNGLVERQNREVLRLLRELTLQFNVYESWSNLLPFIQLILNSCTSSITGFTPHSVIYGIDSYPRRSLLDAMNNIRSAEFSEYPSITLTASHLKNIASHMKHSIDAINKNQLKAIDTNKINPPHTFNIDDLVIRLAPKRSSKIHGFSGPYVITELHGNSGATIRSIIDDSKFKTSLNLLRHFDASRTTMEEAQRLAATDIQEFIVESIVDHVKTPSGYKFLVHWQNFDDSDNSWEPVESFHANGVTNDIFRNYLETNSMKLHKPRNKKPFVSKT